MKLVPNVALVRGLPPVAVLLGGLLSGAPATARGQSPPGFVIARYASRSSLTLYAGYPAGPAIAVAGIAQNPRTGYREEALGAAIPLLATGELGVTAAVAATNTPDGWFGKFFVLPSWTAGRISATADLEYYAPLGRVGVRELDLSPATVIATVSGRVGVGASYLLSAPADARAEHAAGPALRLAIPRGTVTLDLLRGLARAPSEVRVTVRCAWR